MITIMIIIIIVIIIIIIIIIVNGISSEAEVPRGGGPGGLPG